ncbi:MAG TPA: RICIN domain-containing protein [Ktedonobacteraceae bacterium]
MDLIKKAVRLMDFEKTELPDSLILKNDLHLTLRRAEPQDAEQLLVFMDQVAGESENITFGPGEFGLSLEEERAFLQQNLATPTSLYLVAAYTGNSQADQQWSLVNVGSGYVTIVNRNSGKQLNIPGPTTTQGTQLIQYHNDGNSNGQWSLTSLSSGYYSIVSRYDSQAVDVSGFSTADGAPVVQWSNNGGTNQQWAFVAF